MGTHATPPSGHRIPDKLNALDFHWFIVRTPPHQEHKFAGLLGSHLAQGTVANILEVFCPQHTTVRVERGGREEQAPLFAGFVFVLATQQALVRFVDRYYPEGTVLYNRRQTDGRKSGFLTVPEAQMRFFKDFNENYADRVIVLERPYTDYAFNAKTREPNEIVKVVDGPLKGCTGYLARFKRERRLVFRIQVPDSHRYLTVSLPNVWSLKVARLRPAGSGPAGNATLKERAADLLIGLLQACGCGSQTLPMFHGIVRTLAAKPSLASLCQTLSGQGHHALARRMARLDTEEAGLLLNFVRYEQDNPGYVEAAWPSVSLRPFLTPFAGVELADGQDEAVLPHAGFTEIIRRIIITESVYHPATATDQSVATPYYAHIGLLEDPASGSTVLFANWHAFLGAYFQTSGKANEQLVGGRSKPSAGAAGTKEKTVESFRNFAPTLYKVLSGGHSPVRAIRAFRVGEHTLDVLALYATPPEVEWAKNELIAQCTRICREIDSTVHLAVWRRYLRGVWLHP